MADNSTKRRSNESRTHATGNEHFIYQLAWGAIDTLCGSGDGMRTGLNMENPTNILFAYLTNTHDPFLRFSGTL